MKNVAEIASSICKYLCFTTIAILWAWVLATFWMNGWLLLGLIYIAITGICLIAYIFKTAKYKKFESKIKELEKRIEELEKELQNERVYKSSDT